MTIRYRELPEIPPEQLSPGNKVFHNGAIVTLNSVSNTKCKVTFHHPKEDMPRVVDLSELRPLPVTERRIIELGFTEFTDHKKVYRFKDTKIYLSYNSENTFTFYIHKRHATTGTFIHHLQNLITHISITEFKS